MSTRSRAAERTSRTGRYGPPAVVALCALAALVALSCPSGARAQAPPPITLADRAWNQLAVPADASSLTLGELVGTALDPDDYGTGWVVHVHDPVADAYVVPGIDDALVQGRGFWMAQASGADVTLELPASAAPVDGANTPSCPSSAGCARFPLVVRETAPGPQIWGAPLAEAVPVGDVAFATAAAGSVCVTGCTTGEAVAEGLIAPGLWGFDPVAEVYVDLAAAADPIPPWRGLWVATLAGPPDRRVSVEVPLPEPEAAGPGGSTHYGNSVASVNDVANLPMKAERHALRFEVADAPFELDEVLVWWRYNDPGADASYSAGDGGTYRVSLETVDAGGRPSGERLVEFTEAVDAPNRPNTVYSNAQRTHPVPRTRLEPGLYALVFENLDPDPGDNHASLNGPIWWDFENVLDDPGAADPARPDRAALKEYGDGGWGLASPYGDRNRPLGAFYMPVWAVRDSASGTSIGQEIHYGEAVTSMSPIEGPRRVRQRIVPTGDLDGARLHLMVGRAAGEGPLIVRVDGETVAELGSLPLAPDPPLPRRRGEEHFGWVSVATPDGTVRAGRETVVELESPNGRHRICAGIRNGYYGPKSWQGRAERSDDGGASWRGWRAHADEDAHDVQACAFFSRSG